MISESRYQEIQEFLELVRNPPVHVRALNLVEKTHKQSKNTWTMDTVKEMLQTPEKYDPEVIEYLSKEFDKY